MKTTKSKIKTAAIVSCAAAAAALGGFALVSCGGGFDPRKEIPGINNNAVFLIENNRLSFALGMDIDDADVITKCGCTLTDDEGHEVAVTKAMLDDGRIKYDKFDLSVAGNDKSITVSYKNAQNYIFYSVSEYSVSFYTDESKQTEWKTEHAQAQLNNDLSLALWVDLSDYNYSTDMTARQTDTATAERFCGWYDDNGTAVTGRRTFAVSTESVTLDLHAHTLTDEQFAELDLSYDNRGRRVFSGYSGKEKSVTVPEGVTYINLAGIFKYSPEASPISFEEINVPSTAQLDVPLTGVVNTAGLARINVDAGNAYYSSYNGGLYSKDFKTLHFLPASYDDVEFHPDLETIGRYACAFWQCKAFTIPDNVTILQDYCFYRASLMRIEGFEGVTQGAGVFYGTSIPEMNITDGVANYILMGEENGKKTYSLTAIIDKTVTDYTVKEGTVSIADSAFDDCKALKTVNLGNDLKRIGNLAFSGCSALESITLPQSVETFGEAVFYKCTSLTNVDMSKLTAMSYANGSGVEENTLPAMFFRDCASLESIELPKFLERIGASAFYGCTDLKEINLKDLPLTEIMSAAFYNMGQSVSAGFAIELPATLKALGKQAFSHSGISSVNLEECTLLTELNERTFEYCQKLKSIAIPAGITTIPAYCLYYTRALKTVDFADVTEIDHHAFAYSALATLTDLGKVETLGERAFSSCTSLTTVVLSDTVKYVSGYAFASCSKLVSFTLGANTQVFGSYSFIADSDDFDEGAPVMYSCAKLAEIIVPEANEYFGSIDGVLYGRYVGGRDFGENGVLYMLPSGNGLTEYTMPETVQVTLPYSMHSHAALTSVTMNAGLKNLGKGTFYNSKKLTTMAIPATVSHIGANVILGCTGITTVTLDGANATYETTNGNLIYERGTNTVILYTGVSADAEIKDGTLVIGEASFMSNARITSVIIPDSVTKIESKAFDGCTALKSITLGAGVKDIDPAAFATLRSLESITVSPDNQYFKTSADNTLLYSKDGKTLWLCAVANSTLTDVKDVLAGVEVIGNYAFAYHPTLKAVTLPDCVTTIGNYAFYNCKAVESVRGSTALTTIGNYAFSLANEENKPSSDTSYGNTLKTVLLYGNVKSLGNYTFYGQYGIEEAYFVMTYEQYVALGKTGTNSVYLTRGCPDPKGSGYLNNDGAGVKLYIYSELAPVFEPGTYSYFHFDENGDPVAWIIQQ